MLWRFDRQFTFITFEDVEDDHQGVVRWNSLSIQTDSTFARSRMTMRIRCGRTLIPVAQDEELPLLQLALKQYS